MPRSRLVAILVGLAMITAAVVGYRLSEEPEDFRIVRGSVGSMAAYNDGFAEVSDVRVGTELVDGNARVSTTGMFVVVRLTVQAPGSDEVKIGSAELLSRDTTYAAFTSNDNVSAAAGFETRRDVAFEVAVNRVEDLTVQAWGVGVVSGYHQRLRVHLGITDDNAAQWAAAARGQRVRVDSDAIVRGLS